MAIILPIATKFNDAGVRKAQSAFGGLSKSLGSLAGAAGVAVGLSTVVNVIKDSVTAASDLGESLNAVNVAFGKNAKGILALGEDAAKAVGLSGAEFNSLAVGFSAFTEKIAGSGGDVVGVFDKLSKRGADFASVFNIKGGVNEALGLFRSGLAGETEPLRKFGIDMSAAAVEAYALANGIVKNKKQLTETLKIQARYGLLMQQTAKTQGDFANTFGSLANQQRYMAATVEDLKAKFGNLLLPVMQKVATYINDTVIPIVSKLVDDLGNPKTDIGAAWVDLGKTIEGLVQGFGDFFAQFSENGNAIEGLINVMKSVAQALPALLALKGIMALAAAGKNIGALVGALRGTAAVGGGVVAGPAGKGKGKGGLGNIVGAPLGLNPVGLVAGSVLSLSGSTQQMTPEQLAKYNADVARNKKLKANPLTGTGAFLKPAGNTNITVNVAPGTDPQSTANALVKLLGQYDAANGTSIVKKKK